MIDGLIAAFAANLRALPPIATKVSFTQSAQSVLVISGLLLANLVVAAPFQADGNGKVVMEAENTDANTAQGSHSWVADTSGDYVGTSAMRADPDSGSANTNNLNTTSPRMDYEVEYGSSELVNIWLRGRGQGGSSNSVWVGVDGDDSNVVQVNLTNGSNHVWRKGTAKITVPSGVSTINIWMREDGSIVDRIVLDPSGATPSGNGPAESPRGSGGNTAPDAKDDNFSVPENSATTTLSVLADNGNGADSDADSDPLTITSVTSPGSAGGTVSVNGSNDALLYVPDANYSGTETFDYTISDGNGGTDTATVTVTVTPAGNTAPVLAAIPDKTAIEGQLLSFSITATDVDGTTPTFSADLSNLSGSPLLVDNGDGTATFSWTPATGDAPGPYSVDVTAWDEIDTNLTDVDTFAINVTVPGGGSGPFQADANGEVVIEAENYDSVVALDGMDWTPYTSGSYVGASAMQATPDTGKSRTGGNSNTPRMDYQVEYAQATDVYVWIRGLGPSSASNSIYVGIDGDDTDLRQVSLSSNSTYSWKKNSTTITVPAGVHTVNVRMREDGSVVDRIILKPSLTTPSGDGPPESPRSGGGSNNAPTVSAGTNKSTTPNVAVSLNGSVSDDGLPGTPPLSIQWSQVSGPGTATFANASAAATTVTIDSVGTYGLRLTANDGEFVVTDDVTVTVSSSGGGSGGTPQLPPTPIVHTDPGPLLESDQTGSTEGIFRVDESGAATYTVPIFTAAGTAGVAPEIALTYSSSGGNGIAGMGWSVSGISSIARCRQTYDQDRTALPIAWTGDDRFCLDGQRLVPHPAGQTYGAAGTTYRTEIDSGAIVTIFGNVGGEPDFFSVERKDGSISYYGKAPQSSSNTDAKESAGSGKTMSWSIRHFQDSVLNSIWFDYINDADGRRISEVKWAYGSSAGPTGHNAHLTFNYANRNDVKSGYVAGELFEQRKLLTSIVSHNAGTEVRRYNLNYNESISTSDNVNRLTSIEECVGSTCLANATEFDWRVPDMATTGTSSSTLNVGGVNFSNFQLADVNGDGRMDIVWFEGTGTNRNLKYAFSDGASFTVQSFAGGGTTLSLPVFDNDPSDPNEPHLQVLDYNLDGRQDVAYYDVTADVWKILLSEPFGNEDWRLKSTAEITPLTRKETAFLDVDSNGTADAVYWSGGSFMNARNLERDPSETNMGSDSLYHFGSEYSLHSSSLDVLGVSSAAADIDGDGQVEVAMVGQGPQCNDPQFQCEEEVRIFKSTGGFFDLLPESGSPGTIYPEFSSLQIVDINADGLSDVFYGLVPGSQSGNHDEVDRYRLMISKGDGTFVSYLVDDVVTPNNASIFEEVANPQLADWDMDGYPDLVWKESSNGGRLMVRFWDNASAAFGTAAVAQTAPHTSNDEIVFLTDFNGDAALDIIMVNYQGDPGVLRAARRADGGIPKNVAVNRIEKITNGLGAETDITYEPLSYSGSYERLQVATGAGTAQVCEPEGGSGEQYCYDEIVQVANKVDFYESINGEWHYPSTWQYLDKNSPILEFTGPMYVVTQVESSAPAFDLAPSTTPSSNTSSISYQYGEARVQAAGRGFLGFERLISTDDQTGVSTLTRYRQDWPFIGRPMSTLVTSSAGHTLSASRTDWEMLEWTGNTKNSVATSGTAVLGSIHITQTEAKEESYDLLSNGASQGAQLSTVGTSTTYDSESNPLTITVTSSTGAGATVQTITTTNTYNTASFSAWEGRLATTSVVTQRPALGGSITRESEFEYYTTGALRGMLRKEIVEPNDSSLMLETEHSYDSFGNLVRSAVTGDSETRCDVNTSAYDSTGRYVDDTWDCLGNLTTRVMSRNSFGQPTLIDTILDETNTSSKISTRVSYGAFGREYFRASDDGSASTTFLYRSIGNCPAQTAYRTSTSSAGGQSSDVCYDVLARETRRITTGFDGNPDAVDILYDSLGRVKHQSEPYDLVSPLSLAAYWTSYDQDILGRTTQTTLPDNSTVSASYQGLSITTTNDKSQSRTETKNVLGEVVSVQNALLDTITFGYDHIGNLSVVTDVDSEVTTITFDKLGRKTQIDDPNRGVWTYEYNNFGELVRQENANDQAVAMTYDGLGRIKTRRDYPNLTCSSASCAEGDTVWTYDSSPNGLGQLDNVIDNKSGYMRAVMYDSLGRVDEVNTNFDAGIYYEKSTYDEFGRDFQFFDASGDGSFTDQGIVNLYNANGYLEAVADALVDNGEHLTTYRKVIAMNARGQVAHEQLGIVSGTAALETTYTYYDETGRARDVETTDSNGVPASIQDQFYSWDTLGNLDLRRKRRNGQLFEETYAYDDLNRLISQTNTDQDNQAFDYFPNGNIRSKTGVDNLYQYGTTTNAGPNAVSNIDGSSYHYDQNGNNTSGAGRTISYSTFDKPTSISKGGHTTDFAYDPDRSRYRRTDNDGTGTTLTRYLANVEIIDRPDGTQERKRYIAGIAVETRTLSSGTETGRTTNYILKDHLGSTDIITDANGAVVQELSFGAFGQRRDATNWEELDGSGDLIDLGIGFDTSVTTRGYTGHEMVDAVGVVHMNGRIYDPAIGRFLQADPFVQDFTNQQSLNRYSYLYNNPLNATDPTGHFLEFLVAGAVFGALGSQLEIPALSGVGNLLVCSASGGIGCAAGFSFGATIGSGGSFADAVRSSLFATASAAAFSAIGSTFDGKGLLAQGGIGHIATHGIAGGILSELQGGKFGHGFMSAGLTKAVNITSLLPGSSTSLDVTRTLIAAVVGGSISEISGGKFANGAVTAAFAQAYNANGAERRRIEEEELSIGQWIDRRIEQFFIDNDIQPLSQGVVDGAAGFGDGVFGAVTLGFGDLGGVRESIGIGGAVDETSMIYRGFETTGNIAGSTVPIGGGLRLISRFTGTARSGVLHRMNHNRFLRIGPGRMPGTGRLPSGTHVPRLSIGPQQAGVKNPHVDLRFWPFD